VRRFNEHFGPTFAEPQAKLTTFPLVVGLDGKDKMSKSLNNHIELAASAEETRKKVMTAVTDPARKLRTDFGHPEVCNVYKLQQNVNPLRVESLAEECRKAKIGCVDCKKLLAEAINTELAPLRQGRAELASRPEYIREVMADGAERARTIARQTLSEVKQKMGLV
jgi:tryptophanyl-tRNA synthetase